MDRESSPKHMDIDVQMEEEDKPSRKRKLCELIRIAGGSRKRKCVDKKRS